MAAEFTSPEHASRQAGARCDFRYYDLLLGAFVTVLLCSNLIGPGKVALLGGLAFGAGNLFFPISYIFGDVLTEVYGYARSRRVIWAGFAGLVFASLMTLVVIRLPADPAVAHNEAIQPALVTVFGSTWRVTLASILAFLVGDFANSYVLARLKVATKGRWLWTRTIGSTIVGQGLDSLIFYPLAFADRWTVNEIIHLTLFSWVFKVAVEVLMTPVTYLVVNFVKRAEGVDHYDDKTNFTPFSLKT